MRADVHKGTPLERLTRTKKFLHIHDLRADEAYLSGNPRIKALVESAGARTHLVVPMLKDDELVGAIVIYRQEVRPFGDKQIELVQNFAAQAVIAIENARLLNELQQRTDDLSESLEQQTATSEVLKVISSSPTNVQPAFDSIAESAVRLCNGQFSFVVRFDGKAMEFASCYGLSAEGLAAFQSILPMPASEDTAAGRAISRRAVVEIPDVRADLALGARSQRLAKTVTYRSIAAVPLLQEGNPIGAIAVARAHAGSFPERQMALLQAFADQAVIAIENVRLFDEVQARTRDLSKSLQQQTATADVLKVISRSTFDLKRVLRTLTESAAQLCEAQRAMVTQRGDDGLYQFVASFGFPEEFEEYMKQNPLTPGRATTTGRVALEGKIVHIPDVLADREYVFPKGQQLGGYRSNLGVPLLRDGNPIGAFVLTRPEVKPFTPKQIELVETFADQAVIAIENARLLNELRKSLQQQTATADVLKVISRSTFDLKAVLTNLVETAVRVCEADIGNIARPIDGDTYKIEANYGQSTALYEELARQTLKIGKGSVIGRTALSRAPVHILDAQTDPDYELRAAREIGDYHTMLGVPMVREGNIIGVFGLARNTVRAFTEKQIELVTTFADQAVIAIENVRLFESVEARTRELAQSLDNLRTTQDRLVQTEKLASLGQLTAGIAHEIKNPLNFVNNFSGVSAELIDELQNVLSGLTVDQQARSEINELTDTLRSNLDKVVQHGKRADAIVKNMLLHSREGSGEHRVVDINALVEESLNLAYHGARAEKQGFNITMERSLDPAAGEVDLFPQDITRVLLNLISNGFYAATKRKTQADHDGYEPTLAASTRSLGDQVEIRIRDNGTGIPPEVKEKMFNPFFTTKPAGEGTGLGLSISHDIIVKQHGGAIEVDTEPGEYTEFRIVLPRKSAIVGKIGGVG